MTDRAQQGKGPLRRDGKKPVPGLRIAPERGAWKEGVKLGDAALNGDADPRSSFMR